MGPLSLILMRAKGLGTPLGTPAPLPDNFSILLPPHPLPCFLLHILSILKSQRV